MRWGQVNFGRTPMILTRSPKAIIPVLALALALGSAGAGAEERPPLKGISGVRISNYGAPSRLFEGREVKEILAELEELRGRGWRQGDLRMRCYATIQLMHGAKPLTVFRLRPEFVLERAQDKDVPSYNLQIAETDLPKIRQLLKDVPPSTVCD